MTTTIAAFRVGALMLGGVKVEDSSVVLFDLWRAEPIYHRYGNWPRDDARNDVDATACGRPTWATDRKQTIGTTLPIVHAETIGRPCAKCFPEAREALACKQRTRVEAYGDEDA
jgi:hypothetical protein